MDFGSGGGLPAIPLSIARPEWRCTLIESTGKKTAFLHEVRETLQLDNVAVTNKFLEPGKNAEGIFYDLITARGVSDLQKLFSIAGPRLNKDGFFIAFKGPQGRQELQDSAAVLKKMKIALYDCLEFKLPFLEAERRLFIFQKV
jgi:16S rRNA (guanine527-N7)-methyltransferase